MRVKCKYITMSGKCQKHSTPEVNEYCLGSPCEDYEGFGTKEVAPRYIDANILGEMTKTINGRAYVPYDVIMSMTPEDAEPVRHGKLYRTDAYPHRLYCSECFKTLIPNEEICFEKNEFPKYCMWCGAKMEEED